MIRKHVELGIEAGQGSPSKSPEAEDSTPSSAGIPTPEGYPARRYTEPVAESDRAPGGKWHRDWTPDSKSPDVRPDGSLARPAEPTAERKDDEGRRWAQLGVVVAVAALLILVLYLF